MMRVNGEPCDLISIRDRGLLYGDGVFRTLLARDGIALDRKLHLQKIQHDSAKLGIVCPALSRLSIDLDEALLQHPDCIIKLIVTRGPGSRGYSPLRCVEPSHILDVSPIPVYPADWITQGVRIRVCATRLSAQPRLAGIKHLNRLENVLAAAESDDADIAEGLLLDGLGHVIAGVRSNLFLLREGVLITPPLNSCGVAGVQRDRVMAYAQQQGVPLQLRDIFLDEVYSADELFLVNSVIGVWSVRALEHKRWTAFSFVTRMRSVLAQKERE